MGINVLSFIAIISLYFIGMVNAVGGSITIGHNIQHDVLDSDLIHVFIEFEDVDKTEVVFQFNVDEAFCSQTTTNKRMDDYPFAGSASSSNYIDGASTVYKVLPLAAYQMAWPCKNLKMYVIDKTSKEVLSTYLINENEFGADITEERLFASIVVDKYLRTNFILTNRSDIKFEVKNIKLGFECDENIKIGNVIYEFEFGSKTLKPSEMYTIGQEVKLEGNYVNLSSCKALVSYVSKTGNDTKKRILETEMLSKITPRLNMKLYK